MAKKYYSVGAVIKGNDGKMDYIKINGKMVDKLIEYLKTADRQKGAYINLSNKMSQAASVQAAVENGRMSQEVADKRMESIEKTPDFVRFNLDIVVEE